MAGRVCGQEKKNKDLSCQKLEIPIQPNLQKTKKKVQNPSLKNLFFFPPSLSFFFFQLCRFFFSSLFFFAAFYFCFFFSFVRCWNFFFEMSFFFRILRQNPKKKKRSPQTNELGLMRVREQFILKTKKKRPSADKGNGDTTHSAMFWVEKKTKKNFLPLVEGGEGGRCVCVCPFFFFILESKTNHLIFF